jgi:hypothetical protein
MGIMLRILRNSSPWIHFLLPLFKRKKSYLPKESRHLPNSSSYLPKFHLTCQYHKFTCLINSQATKKPGSAWLRKLNFLYMGIMLWILRNSLPWIHFLLPLFKRKKLTCQKEFFTCRIQALICKNPILPANFISLPA